MGTGTGRNSPDGRWKEVRKARGIWSKRSELAPSEGSGGVAGRSSANLKALVVFDCAASSEGLNRNWDLPETG